MFTDFRVATDSFGHISSWDIFFSNKTTSVVLGDEWLDGTTAWNQGVNDGRDIVEFERCSFGAATSCNGISYYDAARVDTDGIAIEPGSWTASQVPVPGTLALFGLGVAGIASARRKKKAVQGVQAVGSG